MAGKSYNGGAWTEARFRSFVVSALRSASRRWPVKYQVLKEACVGRYTNKETGKLAQHYKCAHCSEQFPAKLVAVDHIEPVVHTTEGFVSWDRFVERLFCEKEGLQVLCKVCHKEKTAKERKERNVHARTGRGNNGKIHCVVSAEGIQKPLARRTKPRL